MPPRLVTLILSGLMFSKFTFGFTSYRFQNVGKTMTARKIRVTRRFFAVSPQSSSWLEAAVRRASNRLVDHVEDETNSIRQAAMETIVEKLANGSSAEVQQIFEQVNKQANASSPNTNAFIDPTLRRVMRTLDYSDAFVERSDATTISDQASSNNEEDDATVQVVDSSIETRTEQLIRQCLDRTVTSMEPPKSNKDVQDDIQYGSNPTITATALAHSLWRFIIRPGVDTIIDATAGNGHDSVQLAKMLFSSSSIEPTARLICMDIQEEACSNVTEAISATLTFEQMNDHVEIVHSCHSKLPVVAENTLGLVVYNLGFLPGSQKEIKTKTKSTLSSLAQASAMVRLGGMISVMTYPRSNPVESDCVKNFLEQLAEETKRFRVHEHKQLARQSSPILYTATRIK